MTKSKIVLIVFIIVATFGFLFINFWDTTNTSDIHWLYAFPIVVVGILWQFILNDCKASIKLFIISLLINTSILLISLISPVYKSFFDNSVTILLLWATPILMIVIHRFFYIYAKNNNQDLNIITLSSGMNGKGLYTGIDYVYYLTDIAFIGIWYYIILSTKI